MDGFPILSFLIWLPALGAAAVLAVRAMTPDVQQAAGQARVIAFATTIIALVGAIAMQAGLERAASSMWRRSPGSARCPTTSGWTASPRPSSCSPTS
jgi:NADH:ubiquinone oxidoreductase subunit 4 (subunit M)